MVISELYCGPLDTQQSLSTMHYWVPYILNSKTAMEQLYISHYEVID